jgi:hypothetical protein
MHGTVSPVSDISGWTVSGGVEHVIRDCYVFSASAESSAISGPVFH